MAYERRTFTGGVPETTLASGCDASTLNLTISDATGWPTGSAGDFAIIIDRGTDSEEKVMVDTRVGTSLTVASGGRGIDGTTGVTHNSGATVEHVLLARDIDEANAHIADTALDHHTQYLNNARHDVEARHTFGGAYGTPATPSNVGTTAAAGSGNNPAKEDHVHALGTGAVSAAGHFGAGVVDAAAIATGAVGSAELATDAVTTVKILDDNVTTSKLADDAVDVTKLASGAISTLAKFSNGISAYYTQTIDPGAVGNGILWFDLTNRQIKVRNAANSAWEVFGEKVTPWTDYTPTLTNVTLGTGGHKYGHYMRIGDTCIVEAGFTLGTGTGDVTGTIIVSLPFTAAEVNQSLGAVNRFTFLSAGWAIDSSATATYASVGAIDSSTSLTTVRAFATAGATASWDNNTPFDWTNSDHFHCLVVYKVDD